MLIFLIISVDLEWKLIYVGSAENQEHDQVLDTVLVGDIHAGKHMFVFQVSTKLCIILNFYIYELSILFFS